MVALEKYVGEGKKFPSRIVLDCLRRFIPENYNVTPDDLANFKNNATNAARDSGVVVCYLLTRLRCSQISDILGYKETSVYEATERIQRNTQLLREFGHVYNKVSKKVSEKANK